MQNCIFTNTEQEFFQSQIGGVSTVNIAYNSRGQSTGVATVIFKRAQTARKAVAKYNNAPIDGKKKTLKLELVIDPTQKSLASRITPNVLNRAPLKQKLQNKRKGRAVKAAAATVVAARATKKVKQKKQQKKQKKTVEQLDQEMADYFAQGEKEQSA